MKPTLLYTLLLCLLLTACRGAVTPPPRTAEEHYQEARVLFENRRYREAVAVLEIARATYESAETNRNATLLLADTHFAAEDYPEATTMYEIFLRQHPGDPDTPRALSQLGKSYYHQILAIDRDQTAARNTVVTFESLQRLYPDHPLAGEAPEYIRFGNQHLARHELYVGRFYYRTGELRAAIQRLRAIGKNYPDFTAMDQVNYYLGRAYLDNGHHALAVQTLETLLRDHPDSKLYSKAQRILRRKL